MRGSAAEAHRRYVSGGVAMLTSSKGRHFLAVVAILVYGLLLPSSIEAGCRTRIAQNETLSANFIERLKAGGLIIVLRHVSTEGEPVPVPLPFPDNCDKSGGRVVSKPGLEQAEGIKSALAKLNIEVSLILHSELCRAGQTAHTIFDQERPIPTKVLVEGCCQEWLHNFILSTHTCGNIVLVTHSTNLNRLGVDELVASEDGIAAIFDSTRSDQTLSGRYLGCVLPKDWQTLAKPASAGPPHNTEMQRTPELALRHR